MEKFVRQRAGGESTTYRAGLQGFFDRFPETLKK
jgi:hypothetical protein